MISFLLSLVALVLGYLLYGRFVEKVFGPGRCLICGLSSAVSLPEPCTTISAACSPCVTTVQECLS